jgi:hypothetical protein
MRVNELITEDDSGGAGSGNTGKKGKLHKNHHNSIPGATRYPDTAAHYYDMYRYGLHLASSPDHDNVEPAGPTANEMVTIAYSDVEKDMHNAAAKKMGFKGKAISSHGSRESKDVHSVSPVSNWNKK